MGSNHGWEITHNQTMRIENAFRFAGSYEFDDTHASQLIRQPARQQLRRLRKLGQTRSADVCRAVA